MLLRIEKLPPNQNSQSQSHSQSRSQSENEIFPPLTLHINLNTASHHRQGTLLQVGRKNSDLAFPNEKSLSRTHCRLRLISLNGKSPNNDNDNDNANNSDDATEEEDNGNENDIDNVNKPLGPGNEEERKACEESIDGLAIMLDDLGSKFGTKASYTLNTSKNSNTPTSPKSNSDNETTDDEETDDEEKPIVSTDSSSNNNNNTNSIDIIKSVEKNGSIILPTLSLSKNETKELNSNPINNNNNHNINNNNNNNLTTIIHCGTARFRVTRIPLNICLSRTSSTDKKKITSIAPSIGAYITPSLNEYTTHLITPNRTTTAKVIGAWCLSIPIVNANFIFDLYEITRKEEKVLVLPNVEEYKSDGVLKMDELEYRVGEPRLILQNYLILSMMDTEAEMLGRCGGAMIHKLYTGEKNAMTTFWKQDDDFIDKLIKENEDKGDKGKIVCWLDCTSRKVKKGKDYLVRKMIEGRNGSANLRCITQTSIVNAITTLSIMKDIEGLELTKEIAEEEGGPHGVGTDAKAKAEDTVEEPTQYPEPDEEYNVNIDIGKSESNPQPKSKSQSRKEIDKIDDKVRAEINIHSAPIGDSQSSRKKSEQNDEWTSNSQKRSKSGVAKLKENNLERHGSQSKSKFRSQSQSQSSQKLQRRKVNTDDCASSQKHPKPVAALQQEVSKSSGWISSQTSKSSCANSKGKKNRQEESQSSGWIISQKSRSKKSDGNNSDHGYEPQFDDIDEVGELQDEGSSKASLPTSADGWLLAPKGNRRAQYKRKITDVIFDQQGVLESAQTETCQLIVKRKILVDRTRSDSNSNASRKDFKRFCKNSIIAGARMHAISQIRLVSLLPKESERQRELAADQLQSEQAQRDADALFADDGDRRKRGINNYFKPSGRSSRSRRG